MIHLLLSAHPTPRSLASWMPSGALSAARLVLHFVEMLLAMYVGMLIFMAVPGVMALPGHLHQLGMAVSMTLPMVAWMRFRGHGWRHGAEMAAGMLVPWAAVLGLVELGAAQALPWLAGAADPAMLLGMLGIMLVRREHYAHGGSHQPARSQAERQPARRVPWRQVFLAVAYVGAVLVVPLVVGTANYAYKTFGTTEPLEAPAYSGALPAPPTPDPNKKIAVVLSGADGAEIGDSLEAFEILARSGAFNVYSVAPERTVLPLLPGGAFGASGLDFVPHFSFAEYDALVGTPPDLIAVPALANYTPERHAAVLDWIRAHFGAQTTILGICTGTMVVADTGLVAGHTAVTNTWTFPYVESHEPNAHWLHDLRYVDDGQIVTSSNLTAGIDATLHVVDRFAGRATALEVARQIGYTHIGALDDPRFQPPDNLEPQKQISLTVGFEGLKQPVGVPLYEGVTELGMAGLLDPYFGSQATRPYVMAPQRGIVLSRDGFLFVPRYDFSTVPMLDRVLVPAGDNAPAKQRVVEAWSVAQPRHPTEDIYQNVGVGETAYDATFADIARTHNGSFARAVANQLLYPAALEPEDAAWPVGELLTALALSLFGAAAVYGATHRRQAASARN